MGEELVGNDSARYCLYCSRSLEGSGRLPPYCDSVCEARYVEKIRMMEDNGEPLNASAKFTLRHGADWREKTFG